MLVYGTLDRAQLEYLSADPTPALSGRIYYRSDVTGARLDTGSAIKQFLLNDDQVYIGTSGTAATNTRLYRSAAGRLSAVIGSDATAEGTQSSALAQFGHRFENYTSGTRPSTAAGAAGRPVWITDSAILQMDTGAAFITFVDTATAQTLTNKTISGSSNTLTVRLNADVTNTLPIANGGTGQTSAILAFNALSPNTTKGDLIVYDGSNNVRVGIGGDGTVLLADSSQTTGLKWAAMPSGAKQYLAYYNFENNATTGFSLCNATISGTAPTGALTLTAASVTTFATTNTNPLAGTYSLNTASSAAWSQGQGFCSSVFTIDREDRAKVLTFRAYYEVVSGASNANWSGAPASQTFAWFIYDVTNAAWIQPAGFCGMTQSSGPGYVTCTFQTPSNGSQFRVVCLALNASAGAVSINWDDLFCGPQTAPIGPVISDWITYTPTGGWVTNTTHSGRYRRVGDSLEVEASTSCSGAPNSATYTLFLPTGMTIDTTKLAYGGGLMDVLGEAVVFDNVVSNTGRLLATVSYSTTSSVFLNVMNDSAASAHGLSSVTQAVPFTAGANTRIGLRFVVPIVGWSSNLQMSNDTDNRVIAAYGTGLQIPTGTLANSYNAIIFGSLGKDSSGAYNATTGVYTVGVTGWYDCSAQIEVSATYANTNFVIVALYKNGSGIANGANIAAAAQNIMLATVNTSVYCNAGDTLQFYSNTNSTTPTYTASRGGSHFSIKRNSGSAVIAATESVNAIYNTAAGQSIPNNTNTTVVFGTKERDSHGTFAPGTGIYTVGVSGMYLITANLLYTTAAFSAGNFANISIKQNSSLVQANEIGIQATASFEVGLNVSGMAYCVAGDTLQIQTIHNAGAARSLVASGIYNRISISRIGN